jgi:hypothetical protein
MTNHEGILTVAGALADGATFYQTVPVAETGAVPVFQNLYPDGGLLLGWLNLTNFDGATSSNALIWIKAPSRWAGLYPKGFTNLLSWQAGPWTNPPAKTPAIVLTNGTLVISNTSLSLDFNVALQSNNILVKLAASPANSLSGSIKPKTGLLTIIFGGGKGNRTSVGAGAVLQASTNAAGFFLTRTNAGSILLEP